MTSDEILTFIYLAHTKNFSKTADLLFTSQSAVSARLKTLETQLGQPLFIRDTKYVELTLAGEDFLNYAVQINRLIEESRRSVRVSGKYKCRLAISAPESYWNNMLFPALDAYFEQHKDISFNLFCDHSEVVIQQILDNQADIGIICIYIKRPEIEIIPLQESPFLLVCSPRLPLAEQTFTPENIDSFPFIYMDWGDAFQEWLSRNYLPGAHFLEAEKVFMFLKLILSEKGVGFMPERIARPYLTCGRLRQVPYSFSDQAPRELSYIIYRKKKLDLISPVLQEIISYSKALE